MVPEIMDFLLIVGEHCSLVQNLCFHLIISLLVECLLFLLEVLFDLLDRFDLSLQYFVFLPKMDYCLRQSFHIFLSVGLVVLFLL